MRPISALMCVYNDNVFTKACLESIEPLVEQIVIVEGSWNGPRGTYDYGKNEHSDDGTREIVEQFASKHPSKVTLVDSIDDEECSRNLGLNCCEHDWVMHLDSDEFYWPVEIQKLKDYLLEEFEVNGYDRLFFQELSFYFNFRHYMRGAKIRMFNSNLGIHYASGNGVGDILEGGINASIHVGDVSFAHFQWIGDRFKVLATPNIEREMKYQVKMGQDPEKVVPMGGWRWWLQQIYTKFDGTNLKALEAKARGSIHPWSFLHEEHRNNPLYEFETAEGLPEAVRRAPWFNFEEKGLVILNADT